VHKDCHVCSSEGFEAESRLLVSFGKKSIIATLNIIDSDLLSKNQASLSEYAWKFLGANDGDEISLSHPKPLTSFSYVRSKIYGNVLNAKETKDIVDDIAKGLYSDIHISAFLTACAGGRMNIEEIINLTKAMIAAGDTIKWHSKMVVDKHCVGGLPGNRTSPIVVAIVAAFGLTMPKTSSRSITSPAGTADTMEVFAPVEMDIKTIKVLGLKKHFHPTQYNHFLCLPLLL
jgi:thymidine phosphorylase